jgi:hypothetical protein
VEQFPYLKSSNGYNYIWKFMKVLSSFLLFTVYLQQI